MGKGSYVVVPVPDYEEHAANEEDLSGAPLSVADSTAELAEPATTDVLTASMRSPAGVAAAGVTAADDAHRDDTAAVTDDIAGGSSRSNGGRDSAPVAPQFPLHVLAGAAAVADGTAAVSTDVWMVDDEDEITPVPKTTKAVHASMVDDEDEITPVPKATKAVSASMAVGDSDQVAASARQLMRTGDDATPDSGAKGGKRTCSFVWGLAIPVVGLGTCPSSGATLFLRSVSGRISIVAIVGPRATVPAMD